MNKVILEVPVGITMEFAGRNTPHSDVGGFLTTASFPLLAPRKTNLGSEFGDVFVIFEVRPKFYLGTGFNG